MAGDAEEEEELGKVDAPVGEKERVSKVTSSRQSSHSQVAVVHDSEDDTFEKLENENQVSFIINRKGSRGLERDMDQDGLE